MSILSVKTTLTIVMTVAIAGLVTSVLGAYVASRTIPNVGNLKSVGVGVYWDGGCTNLVQTVDWGTLEPDATKQCTIYVKNEGNTALRLNMTISNWNPQSASNYISLSWNLEGYVVSAGSTVAAVLTLSVSSTVSGVTNFNFDIIITGTGT